jgi:hypothetical protein
MDAAARRIKAQIRQTGDPLVSGGVTRYGHVRPASPERAREYLSDAEAANRPVRFAWVAGEDTLAAGATVTWDGVAHTLMHVEKMRAGNVTLARLWVLTEA